MKFWKKHIYKGANMKFDFNNELRIGQIIEIKGNKVVCKIFSNKNGPFLFVDGNIIKNITIGNYVVMPIGFNLIVGKIEGEFANEKENKTFLYNEIELISRKIEISIFGTYEKNKFSLGISSMPLINSDVYIAPKDLIDNIFVFNDIIDDHSINIGYDLFNNQQISVSIEKLFANHIGIFGNTGSGKSNTLSYLYTKLFEKFDFDKKHTFIFLDFNNEFLGCFTETKTVVNLGGQNNDKLYLPRDTVFNVEFWQNLSDAAEKTHKPFIKDVINAYKNKSINTEKIEEFIESHSGLDIISKNKLNDVLEIKCENDFDYFVMCMNFVAISRYGTSRSNSLDNSFWALIHRIEQHCDTLSKYIKFKLEEYSNVLVVNMNLLSLEYKLIISYLVSNRYYKLFGNRVSDNNTINLVIDEAHKILSIPHERENTYFKEYLVNTFEEYIKEGRKFGFYLTISSQRPSDISPMFLSQMHNYFIHRLVNQNDINNLSNSISFLDEASFSMISSLKVGSCIFSGLAAKFPTIIQIPKLSEESSPKSNNISITADAKIK